MSATFPPDVIAAAQASQRKWGCPASVCLAQWALESAWGVHMSGKNNPFGIKAKAGEPSTPRMTWEVVNGQRQNVVQNFRDFASMDEAFDQHGRLLASGSAYRDARAVKGDPKAFANALTGHYATDPLYGSKLITIMDAHNLYVYNNVKPAAVLIDAPTYPPKPIASSPAPPSLWSRFLSIFKKAA